MAREDFTIGTDPEFFCREKSTRKMRSAIPFINGTKTAPEPLPSGSSVQRDNVALEFATPPVSKETDFVRSIQAAFLDIMKKVPKELEVVAVPSANFDEDQLNHPEALQFGCDPDYDAYIPAMNPPAHCDDPSFRSCGGHIHLGYVEESGNDFLLDPWGKIKTVLMMDAIHGIVSMVLDNSEEAIKRRQLYGKAGCHRPTDYGVEYRTLSNYWLKSPELVMLMYRLSNDVLRLLRAEEVEDWSSASIALIEAIGGQDRLRSIINDGNVDEAIVVLNEHVRPVLSAESNEILDICLEKCEAYSFEKEWKLAQEVAL